MRQNTAITSILLIEDSPSDVRLIEEVLADASHGRFTVVTAPTLAKGLRMLRQIDVHAILLDLTLPDSYGIDTFHAVIKRAPSLPVIVLTMADNEALGQQMVQEGAQDYVPKDVLMHDMGAATLIRMLRYAIERKRADVALQQAHDQVTFLNERLQAANKDLLTLNKELRYGIQERTEELNVTNEELRVTNEALSSEVEHRAAAERGAQARARRTAILNEVIHVLNEALDLPSLYERSLATTIEQLRFESGFVAVVTDEGYLEVQHAYHISRTEIDAINQIHIDSSPYVRQVYREHEPIILDEAQPDSNSYRIGHRGAVVSIPLLSEGRTIGHAMFYAAARRSFSREERELFQTIGLELGTAVARLRTKEQVQEYAAQLKQQTDHLEELVAERTAQLRNAERLAGIGETAAMIGHDLRNPLQAMQYIVDLQKLRAERMVPQMRASHDWQEVQTLCDRMSEQVYYMDKIVSDLQDYARPIAPECDEVAISVFIHAVLQSLPPTDGVQIVTDVDDLMVRADSRLMQRVFTNLILNAIQAMPNGGTLTISATSVDDSTAIHVSDTGVGIPADIRDKVLSPLTTSKAKGTGLGLAVVKRIVDAHSGTISFESEEGKGTTFIVQLPTDKGHAHSEAGRA
ncbi:MAG: ATP-binding protein [Halobacteriota archaeon]